MEELPDTALSQVLEFLDVASRVRLAIVKTTFQHRIYHECRAAWETIDFSSLSSNQKKYFKDENLSSLLTNVSAALVTKVLNITDCYMLGGDGLLPLRESRVLETVHMLYTSSAALTRLLSILETCMPYKLQHVSMDEYGLKEKDAVRILSRLREAKSRKALDQGTLCDSCNEPLADDSMQIVPSLHGIPAHYCTGCKMDFCRRGSCPVDVRECSACLRTACVPCGVVRQCLDCKKSYCFGVGCSAKLLSCELCDTMHCVECDAIGRCSICECVVCPDCSKNGEEEILVCNTCWETKQCIVCSMNISDCVLGATCYDCGGFACENVDCESTVKTCDSESCFQRSCTVNCDTMEECNHCNKSFCKSHDRLGDCSKCGFRHCRRCPLPEWCRICQKACYENCTC